MDEPAACLADAILPQFLQAVGVDPLVAGNVIQISFVLGLMVLWVFTYVFRVANKEMTYVKQLKVAALVPPSGRVLASSWMHLRSSCVH